MHRPATGLERYSAAYAAAESLAAAQDGTDAACATLLLGHGRPTSHVVVLFHGFTNCPTQWSAVARDLHARGATVVVPLAPGHGRTDRQPTELTSLTPSAIIGWAETWTRLARDLGTTLTVAGFSFGGVCAAWVAGLDETDRVLLLAPSFLPFGYPVHAARWLGTLARALPERYLWWDPVRRENMAASPYGYTRLSRRGIGATFEVGRRVGLGEMARTQPLERATLVLNEADLAVNATAAQQVFDRTIRPQALDARVYRLPASERYPHDVIDPFGSNAEREHEVRDLIVRLIDVKKLEHPVKSDER